MKKMKKLAALLLALVLVMAMVVVPANAAGSGEITFNSSSAGVTYNIWKIFDYVYVDNNSDGTPDAQYYTVIKDTAWWEFVNSGAGSSYVTLKQKGDSTTYYVAATDALKASGGAAAFASLALSYANEKNIDPTATGNIDSDKYSVTISGLELGYYLVDSGSGAICSLDTTNPTVTIDDKNKLPTIEKFVNNVESDVVGIKETLSYKIVVTAQTGAKNYAVTDELPTGITAPDSVVVKKGETTLEVGTHYSVTISGQKITIEFTEAGLADVVDGIELTIEYSAVVNADAAAATEMKNTATLYYGNDGTDADNFGDYSKTDSASVYTYQVELTKTDASTPAMVLKGAKFVLFDDTNDKYAKVTDGKISEWVTNKADATTLETDNDGKITVIGLGDASYYFEESEAPAGYMLPADNQSEFVISNANVTISVTNTTGTELPETGGIGTTIFYVVGGVLVLAALVVLISKKRMAA